MGKLVVSEFVSIDGVMEAPGGEEGFKHTGWVMRFPDPGYVQYKSDEIMSHEALLIGRKTYETFAEAWPSRHGTFGDRMNGLPKYVVSTTLKTVEWSNSTLIQKDVAQAVAKLKADLAGDILVHGSRTLVQTLRRHDLVDEYRLMVFPIVLGSGARVWGESEDARKMELVDLRRLESGTVVLVYRPKAA